MSLPAFSNPIVVPPMPGSVSGYVRNSITLNPVEGGQIQLLETTFSDIADPNGYYQIMAWAGTYGVYAFADGYADTTYTDVQIAAENATTLDIYLRPLTANQDNTLIPTGLLSYYPNPFRSQTTINYALSKSAPVTLEIFNLKGQLIKTIVNQNQTKGVHAIIWNGSNEQGQPVATGVYLLNMTAGQDSHTGKLLKLE
jgi:hypothetical protein